MEVNDSREQFNHLVRALSHDMSANFMLLENSFAQLKKSLGRNMHVGFSYTARVHVGVHSQVAHVEACLHESRRFLDDLIRLAQTGNVEMEPGRVDVAKVVEAVLFEQRDLLGRRSIEVIVERPLPVVWCNEGRLKQVVTNLVRNAVYHGCDRHRPQIIIAPSPSQTPPATAAFEVRDNGPGIDPRRHKEIFLPGRRLPTAGAEGSGMGLAIVKKIVDYYDGSVYVDPDCRNGTTLVVALPTVSKLDGEGRRWKLEPDGHRQGHPMPLHGSLSSHSKPKGDLVS